MKTLIILFLLLFGCSTITVESKDGVKYTYTQPTPLINIQLGSNRYAKDNGSISGGGTISPELKGLIKNLEQSEK